MELNLLDGGTRKFVIVEWDENIFNNICTKRVKEIATKCDVNYKVLKLGNRVFDDFGMFNRKLNWMMIARYLFYSETKCTINVEAVNLVKGFIGEKSGKNIFLIYNAEHPEESNKFDLSRLDIIKNYLGEKVVYAIQCSISGDKLRDEHIVFKQIPYESRGKL